MTGYKVCKRRQIAGWGVYYIYTVAYRVDEEREKVVKP